MAGPADTRQSLSRRAFLRRAGVGAAGGPGAGPGPLARALESSAVRFSLPWSSTMVGLAYDRRYVVDPIRSAGALFDRRFAGKVALSADPAATLGLVALASGAKPASITENQAAAAVDRVRGAVSSGQVRSFTTTEQIDDLVAGRASIAIARSDE